MESFNPQGPAVRFHLAMLQAVVQRMAENSRSCKFWSTTVFSAVVLLSLQAGTPGYAGFATVPLLMFCCLDVYYLSLERRFRLSYDSLLAKLREGAYGPEDFYRIAPAKPSLGLLWKCCRSASICLFYFPAIGIAVALSLFPSL